MSSSEKHNFFIRLAYEALLQMHVCSHVGLIRINSSMTEGNNFIPEGNRENYCEAQFFVFSANFRFYIFPSEKRVEK